MSIQIQICRTCGRSGHSRSSSSACPANPRAQAARRANQANGQALTFHHVNEAVGVTVQHGGMHTFVNETPDQALTFQYVNEAVGVTFQHADATTTNNPQPRCNSCGELGHLRRNSHRCRLNAANRNHGSAITNNNEQQIPNAVAYDARILPSNFRPTADARQGISANGRHSFGEMSHSCPHCGAKTWIAERTSDSSIVNPSYSFCCNKGKVTLTLPSPPPAPLLDLLTGQDAVSRTFRTSIRAYNMAFAFTSVHAQVHSMTANNMRSALTQTISVNDV
ncbi:hypothetical protein O0I10_012240 [Lichtheimia ornata]|uniref:CCHC-type domain-containing protein n=1 Tax=Lichtheimia ornata TaxID=688661 RepID=A0AAD7URC6_9FUNG|nr:uncharacterized protein O0I10_012240 [Lichtheimia ornata]KAJ8652134.1 hypothetical protein O0I10_012240 [Lichtheimia ornata]